VKKPWAIGYLSGAYDKFELASQNPNRIDLAVAATDLESR
jgi:hypothetical protein